MARWCFSKKCNLFHVKLGADGCKSAPLIRKEREMSIILYRRIRASQDPPQPVDSPGDDPVEDYTMYRIPFPWAIIATAIALGCFLWVTRYL